MTKAFIVDEFCDFLDPNKICDNCGACLNLSDADLHAIKIEEISKNVDENAMIESDLDEIIDIKEEVDIPNLEELIIKAQKIDPNMKRSEIEKVLLETYANLNENLSEDVKYILEDSNESDSFDEEIIYLEDLDLTEADLEDETEEVFPGLRKLKKK
ncbi:MAG: hypothetical protein ACRDAU_15120 [Clostridium sp.]